MSLDPSGSKASQASVAFQPYPSLASAGEPQNPQFNTKELNPSVLENVSTLLSNQEEELHSEQSDDTIIAAPVECIKMGNQQCTSKHHSSKSDEKEEGDVWVKRDDDKEKAKEKRREMRKKKKRREHEKVHENKNAPLPPGQSNKPKCKTENNVIDTKDQCLPESHEVKEIDRWAEVRMADDFSSSSTGYHTPEARTPKTHRTEKVTKQQVNKNVSDQSGKIIEIESKINEAVTIPLKENSLKLEKINTKQNRETCKDKDEIIISESVSKQINDTHKTPIDTTDTKLKNEALAKLDSLTNSPRSQRRHGLLLSNEEANLISLPPAKEQQNFKTCKSISSDQDKLNHSSTVSQQKDEEIKDIPKMCKEGTTLNSKPCLNSVPASKTAFPLQEMTNGNRITNEKSNNNELKSLCDAYSTNSKAPIEIVEPPKIITGSSSKTDSSPIRTSTIEIIEDNRANELREATAETIVPVPGPGVAVMSCIPPPEKALITHVPPPSPSSIEIVEEEEDENLDICDIEIDRKSKEMETFSDTVCQRLSLLLETHELEEQKVDDSPADDSPVEVNDMPEILLENESCSCCTDSESDFSDDEYDENDYIQESDSCNDYSDDNDDSCPVMSQVKTIVDSREIKVASAPRGTDDTTTLDTMNNNNNVINLKREDILSPFGDKRTEANTMLENQGSVCKHVISDVITRTHEMSDHDPLYDKSPNYVQETMDNKSIEEKDKTDNKLHSSEIDITFPNYQVYNDGNSKNDIFTFSGSEITSSNITSANQEECNSKIWKRNVVDYNSTASTSDTDSQPKRSRLDESLKALFKVPQMEESNPSALVSLQGLLDVDFDVTPTSDNHPEFVEDISSEVHETCTQTSTGRRSLGCTESSDLDVSEQRDDLSTDSMLADDEDEGEVLFSRTYPEPSGGEVLVSCTVINSAIRCDQSDSFWDDDILSDEDEEIDDDIPEQDLLTSDAYVDINDSDFDSARKQMQDIHEHLKNLKYQMNNFQDDVGAASCAPVPPSDDSDPASKRRAMTD